MSFHIQSNDVVFFGTAQQPRAVRWWAQNGLIHYEDSRTGKYETMSRRTFLERLQQVNDMIAAGRRSENAGFLSNSELERHMRFVEQGVELARKAKAQGDPMIPGVLQHKDERRPVSLFLGDWK